MRSVLKTAAALIALGLSFPAVAAVDGTLGATSTGSLNVNIAINSTDQFRIYDLDDIDLGLHANDAGLIVGQTDFCATRNTSGNIKLTLGSYAGSLTNPSNSLAVGPMPASVKIFSPGQIAGGTPAGEFTAGGSVTSSPSPSTCSSSSSSASGDGFTLVVSVNPSGAPDGNYSATYLLIAAAD